MFLGTKNLNSKLGDTLCNPRPRIRSFPPLLEVSLLKPRNMGLQLNSVPLCSRTYSFPPCNQISKKKLWDKRLQLSFLPYCSKTQSFPPHRQLNIIAKEKDFTSEMLGCVGKKVMDQLSLLPNEMPSFPYQSEIIAVEAAKYKASTSYFEAGPTVFHLTV